MINWRQTLGTMVIQICWIAPGPSTSARTTVLLPSSVMQGAIFQPCPSSRAASPPTPSVAAPPCPRAPVGFYALIERVCASDSRARLPRPIPKPSNVMCMAPPTIKARVELSKGRDSRCIILQRG
jgi:hypothetical protein